MKAHGRTLTREVAVYPFIPWDSGLLASESLIVITSQSTRNKTGVTNPPETQYGVSSASPQSRTPLEWLAVSVGHWRGVEARNHNRRDVSLNEDRIRSKNTNICSSLALLCGTALFVSTTAAPHYSIPETRQYLAANPRKAVAIAVNRRYKLVIPHAKPKRYLQDTVVGFLQENAPSNAKACA